MSSQTVIEPARNSGIWELFEGNEEKQSIKIRGVPNGTRIIVVGDAQIPLEDRRLLATIFEDLVPAYAPVKERGKPAPEYHLFLIGDMVDNFTLSTFLSRVNPKFTLGDELNMLKNYLEQWAPLFTHKHFAFGNHEDRYEREIYAGNRQFARFTRPLHEVLNLEDLGYDWVPYLRHYDFEGFILTHGDSAAKHAAMTMLNNYMSSGASGHVNRPQLFTWSDAAGGDPATWYTLGMTCRLDIGDIVKDWRRIQPWMQGIGIGEVVDGVLYFEHVNVHHNAFRAAGKIYRIRED